MLACLKGDTKILKSILDLEVFFLIVQKLFAADFDNDFPSVVCCQSQILLVACVCVEGRVAKRRVPEVVLQSEGSVSILRAGPSRVPGALSRAPQLKGSVEK